MTPDQYSYLPLARPTAIVFGLFASLVMTGCGGTAAAQTQTPARIRIHGAPQCGVASWHAPAPFSRESRTASNRRWVSSELVAAHKTLPLGTMVAVTNLANGRQVLVKIIDRGPYCRGRIVDLSKEAASRLQMINAGTAHVRLEVVTDDQEDADAAPHTDLPSASTESGTFVPSA